MKKILLGCIISLAWFSGSSQISLSSVTLQYNSADNTTPIDGTLSVDNGNSHGVDINIIRTIVQQAYNLAADTTHVENFCFGQYCYVPGTDTSLFTTPMAANSSDPSFVSHVDPMGFDGTDIYHYRIYDINNPSDSVAVTLEFNFGVAGISESKSQSFLKFNNAVNNFAVLGYHLPSTSSKARVDFYNMLGSKMKSVPLDDQQGAKIVSTSDLANGVYLLSLVVNNTVMHTYKMVVSHRGN